MSRKIFVPLLIFSYFLSIFFIPKKVWACSYNSTLRTCVGTCASPANICQFNETSGKCSCVPAGGQPTSPPSCLANGKDCTKDVQCCSGYCAETNCATRPPNPTNTPKPTAIPCDTDGNNICNTSNPACRSQCDPCQTGYVGVRTKTGNCYTTDACRKNLQGPCYEYSGLYDPIMCGYCPASSGPTPTPFCQPYACHEMNTEMCPYANIGGCPGGIGHCDNCGGVDCGTCSGGGATPVPTQTSCTSDCINPAVSPCIATTCYNATCLGNCKQSCFGTLPNDCSCANNLCSTQTCTGTCGDSCTGKLTCAPTTLNRFEIRRNDSAWQFTDGRSPGRDITDIQNRLHICDSFLSSESPNPRSLIYVAWLDNANGCSDIDANSVKMRWMGNNTEITMNKLASYQSGPCAYSATVTYPSTTNIPSAQGFQITMKSISGGVSTPWTTVTPDLKLKVWNCQVPVSGSLYKATDGVQECSTGSGFSTPLDGEANFNKIVYGAVNMTVSPPASYGSNNITWGNSYLPLINDGNASNIDGSLLAAARRTRIIELGTGTTRCPGGAQFTIDDTMVSAYSSAPSAQIDFSFIQDQEAWYQVYFGGIRSRGGLEYGVPVTAATTNRFLTLGNSSNDNGTVAASNFINVNGNNNNSEFGSPKNWYVNKNISSKENYSYSYFYNNLYGKKGLGVVGTNWSQRPENGVFFVSNSLTINSNQSSGTPPMVIVNGDIIILPVVTQLNGIYIANGNINIGGTSSTRLTVNGSLYAGGNIGMYRSFTDKTSNNANPAVVVNYDPGLVMTLPVEMVKVLSNWRTE